MSKLLCEKNDGIAVITINRPDAANSLDPEVLCLLYDAYQDLKLDDEIRVVVITGAGQHAFCAGGDLDRFIPLLTGARGVEDEWDKRVTETPDILDVCLLRGFDIDKPVIAAINGFAVAGGMEIVQGTDIRVCSSSSKFGVQEVKWGIFPAGGSTVRLPQQMSLPQAMELLLTGNLIDAQTALQWGFVNRVVDSENVLDTALEIAKQIASYSSIATRGIRRSARACIGLPENAALALETQYAAKVFASDDAKEGPRSFMEKRPAVFKHK